jgi:regulator of protease activity HflC (stomatin/prohibitin superfamily)
MKFTLKAVIIAIAVVIVIALYGGLYTLEEGCRPLSCSLAGLLGNR